MIGPLPGDGTPAYEADINRKDYVKMVKRLKLNARGDVEGTTLVRTSEYRNGSLKAATRTWHCVPTVGHGHFLHVRNPFDPSSDLKAILEDETRPRPQSCYCEQVQGPSTHEPWSSTQSINRRKARSNKATLTEPAHEWTPEHDSRLEALPRRLSTLVAQNGNRECHP